MTRTTSISQTEVSRNLVNKIRFLFLFYWSGHLKRGPSHDDLAKNIFLKNAVFSLSSRKWQSCKLSQVWNLWELVILFGHYLHALAITCNQAQIHAQVGASFSSFGHPAQVWVHKLTFPNFHYCWNICGSSRDYRPPQLLPPVQNLFYLLHKEIKELLAQDCFMCSW